MLLRERTGNIVFEKITIFIILYNYSNIEIKSITLVKVTHL